MPQKEYDIAEVCEMMSNLLSEMDGNAIARIFNAEFANDEQQLIYREDGQFVLDESQNGKIGTLLAADKIKGRLHYFEPAFVDEAKTAQDRNDGTWWVIDTNIPEMIVILPEEISKYRKPESSVYDIEMPDFNQYNVTAALLVGHHEGTPDEIWLTKVSPVLYNSPFWRVK